MTKKPLKITIEVEGEQHVIETTCESLIEIAEEVRHGTLKWRLRLQWDVMRPTCKSDADCVQELAIFYRISEKTVYRYLMGY